MSISLALRKYTGWAIEGDNYESLQWFNTEIEKPTLEQLEAEAVSAAAEFALAELRAERDRRIAETDWWASSDLTMTAEQAEYRQALRDITAEYTSLEDVIWPTQPGSY
jgi:hypothetical protein